MCSIEGSLRLEVHAVGERPERMRLHSVAGHFVDLAGEAGVIKEGDVGEAVLLEVVAEGRVARGHGAGEDGDGVHVLADEVLELGARHNADISTK